MKIISFGAILLIIIVVISVTLALYVLFICV